MTITRVEQISSGAWCVHDLLDQEECQRIRQTGIDGNIEETPAQGDRRHRHHNLHKFQDVNLAERLWSRLQDLVPQEYSFTDASSPPKGFQEESIRDMLGSWKPSGVKPYFTLLYYTSGCHFGPHRDGYQVLSDHERSILTLAIYLSDRPSGHGGATQFVRDSMDMPVPDEENRIVVSSNYVEFKVEADKAGKAVLFQHDLMHQGEPLQVQDDPLAEAAPKWLLLTQVLYERDPSTAPVWTKEQFEARRLLALAEKAEVEGDIPSAIKLYNRAYRLDRSLEML